MQGERDASDRSRPRGLVEQRRTDQLSREQRNEPWRTLEVVRPARDPRPVPARGLERPQDRHRSVSAIAMRRFR